MIILKFFKKAAELNKLDKKVKSATNTKKNNFVKKPFNPFGMGDFPGP